jgi:imidazolonepropionase-like amidohydrolase
MKKKSFLSIAVGVLAFIGLPAIAQDAKPESQILIQNVRIFDGVSDQLSKTTNILIEDNNISSIASDVSAGSDATVIDGGNRVVMPGIIDSHAHVAFTSLPQSDLLFGPLEYQQLFAADQLEKMLMRGVTAVRDMAGNTFSLKRAVDEGIFMGPRIYPSGTMISQTSGHGDFRMQNEAHPQFGGQEPIFVQGGHSHIVDSPGQIRAAARENLRHGASQIKMAAGGGYSSPADPLETMQFTLEELKAGVDAATDFGTYVTVHVYTAAGVNRAIDAGVKSIEHGQLTDKKTLKRMAEEGVFLSTQPFIECHEPQLDAFSNSKLAIVCEGTKAMYKMIKEVEGLKVTHGTDLFFVSQEIMDGQVKQMERLLKWFTPAEILKMATSNVGELLKLSALRDPYPGELGVVKSGALADLLMVDGNPLEDLSAVTDQDNLKIIMKDGVIYKNTLK